MGKRILLADDSVTIHKVVELTFLDEDYSVEAVSDGDQAIARLAGDAPTASKRSSGPTRASRSPDSSSGKIGTSLSK